MLLRQSWFVDLSPWQRWSLASLLLLPPCLLACWLLHHFVEQPGIKLGRLVAARIRDRPKP